MGRRAVGTTKTGRFMNPTDQARKEARKRELKKNKKQRMQVRTSVLKARQPDQILIELEEYDKMELDPSAEPEFGVGAGSAVGFSDGDRLALRVIQEKRRKLLETYDRILSMVQRESPEEAGKLVSARQEYEQRRQQRVLFFEQVRAAENVDTSSIPLPALPPGATQAPGFPPVFPGGAIPPPSSVFAADGGLLPGILKTATLPPVAPRKKPDRKPAGPPPGPPPELSDCEDEPPAKQPQPQPQKSIRFSDEPAPPGERVQAAAATVQPAAPAAALPPAAAAAAAAPPPPLPMHPPAPPAAAAAAAAAASIHRHQPMPQPPQPPVAPDVGSQRRPGQTSFSAAPQLKNLIGDATKLVPTAVRIKRAAQQQQQQLQKQQLQPAMHQQQRLIGSAVSASASTIVSGVIGGAGGGDEAAASHHRQQQMSSSAKDDAYDKFMQEMQGLL